MSRPAQITINLSALRHNYQQVRVLAPHSRILVMVKANAYGHGITRIASGLQNEADAFGVACLEEGIVLRNAGIKNPIVLLEGLYEMSEVSLALEHDFTLVVHHLDQVHMLEKIRNINSFSVWLKIDTGMHRLGFHPEHVQEGYIRLMQCPSVKKPIGFMTHFAEADVKESLPTKKQIELFNSSTQNRVGPRSLANSAGILGWPTTHADWVRPGIMMYGVSPFFGQCGADHHLEPVMTLGSKLIAIRRLSKGERVGYAGTWSCPEDMVVGVAGIGYGDGYPRSAGNGTPVLVNGQPCPLVGRVSMDMLTVDLRTQENAKVGDEVILWGATLPVEVVAEQSKSFSYELLTGIAPRVHVVEKEI